jgi:hypothetical protein
MYPKARIDALTDGIFAVAMTLLALDVRLPDDLHPADARALLEALKGLWPKFFPYVLSFYVLGTSWLSLIRLRSRREFVDRRYASWWLTYLLFATCLPFSTTVVGRFATRHRRCGCMPPTWRRWRRSAISWSCCCPTSTMTRSSATARSPCWFCCSHPPCASP